MDRDEFNDIIKSIKNKNITKEDIEFLYVTLGLEKEDDVKASAVESFLTLAGTNIDLVKKYGVYIDEYYQLPIRHRRNVCKAAYKEFVKSGNFNIDVISNFIVNEVETLEESTDPVVEAIRESYKLLEKNPKINTNGIRYE